MTYYLHFAAISAVLCTQTPTHQLFFRTGKDSEPTDMYGTTFVYPHPHCPKGEFYKVQMLPRGYDPVSVIIIQRSSTVYDELDLHIEKTEKHTYYGDLRNGNSSTLFLPCEAFSARRKEVYGTVYASATGEILLHVLERNDSFAVLPINALGTTYTLLSLPTDDYDTFFFTATPTGNSTVVVTEPSGENTTTVLKSHETYTYRSKTSLTGVRVTCSGPVFIISGMYNSSHTQVVLVEHVRPDHTWGSHYFLPLPFGGKDIDILGVAYTEGSPVQLTLTAKTTQLAANTDGKVWDLSQMLTLVAGVQDAEASTKKLQPLSSKVLIPLGKYWIRIYDISSQTLAVQLNLSSGAADNRLWFQELVLLRRSFSLFYLERGSYVSVLNTTCTRTPVNVSKRVGDRIDNDCDGLVDEEILNGKDDDGDGEKDEDTSPQNLRNCYQNRKAYFWEPNRYRLTRFESNYYEFAQRLPAGYTVMVVISAFVGVVMVFIFFFIVWFVDLLEQIMYPHLPYRVY